MENSEVLYQKLDFLSKEGYIHTFNNKLYLRNVNRLFKLNVYDNSKENGLKQLSEIESLFDNSKRQIHLRYSVYILYVYDEINIDFLNYTLLKISILYNLIEINYSITKNEDHFLYSIIDAIKNFKNARLIVHLAEHLMDDYYISELSSVCFILSTSNSELEYKHTNENFFINYAISSGDFDLINNKKNSFIFNIPKIGDVDISFLRTRIRNLPRLEYIKLIFDLIKYSGSFISEGGYIDKEKGIVSFKNNTCDRCWAKSICWATKFYWLFDRSPVETIKNGKNCDLIRSIIEQCIDEAGIYSQSNKKNLKELNIKINEFNIKLINP